MSPLRSLANFSFLPLIGASCCCHLLRQHLQSPTFLFLTVSSSISHNLTFYAAATSPSTLPLANNQPLLPSSRCTKYWFSFSLKVYKIPRFHMKNRNLIKIYFKSCIFFFSNFCYLNKNNVSILKMVRFCIYITTKIIAKIIIHNFY